MAAKRGLSASILFNQYDLSTYLRSAAPSLTMELLDATTFQAPGGDKIYVTGFRDGKLSLEGFFNSDAIAPEIDDIFNAIIGSETKQVVTVAPEGSTTLGNRCFVIDADTVSYKVGTPATGLIMSSADIQSSSGVGEGIILQPLAALTTTANGTSVNNGAATSRGGAGHLHITLVSGSSPTLDVEIQHSLNDSTWVDLITFTQATDETSQRVETTGTTAVSQVETQTITGAATASADVIVTTTGAGITGSPIATNVAVVNGDTAAQVAGKIRTALGLVAAITAVYTVGGAGADITLTRIVPAANDATLNIAIDGTTNSTGVPDDATSDNTTAGVLGSQIYQYTRAIRTIGGSGGPSFTTMVALTRF